MLWRLRSQRVIIIIIIIIEVAPYGKAVIWNSFQGIYSLSFLLFFSLPLSLIFSASFPCADTNGDEKTISSVISYLPNLFIGTPRIYNLIFCC